MERRGPRAARDPLDPLASPALRDQLELREGLGLLAPLELKAPKA